MAELVLFVCMEGTLINNNLVSKSWALVVCKSSVASVLFVCLFVFNFIPAENKVVLNSYLVGIVACKTESVKAIYIVM